MKQRRVHFDLPKHIYCNHYKDGTVGYYFRITRRPRRYTGKTHPTLQEAIDDLHRFLVANPEKAPRFNGDSPAQMSLFWKTNREKLIKKRRVTRGKK